MIRAKIWFVATLVVGLACVDRQVDVDEDGPWIRCVMVVTYITADGKTFRLQDSRSGDAQVMECTCAYDEELRDPELLATMNDASFDACIEFVEREGYSVEQSTCEIDHQSGEFAKYFGFGEVPGEPPRPCDSAPAGCGVE